MNYLFLMGSLLFAVLRFPGIKFDNVMEITKNTVSPEKEIRLLVDTLMNAFANADATAFSSVFADNADCIIRDGHLLQGREQINQIHQKIFSSIYSEGTTSQYHVESVRQLHSDIALVRIKGTMQFKQGERLAEVNGRISLICVRKDGAWKVTLFQNTSEMRPLSSGS